MDKNEILINLSESSQTEVNKVPFAEQGSLQKIFSAIWMLESEVNNGGFSQYFFNFSGESSGFAVTALQTIHAMRTAEIVERAINAAFPGGLPADPKEIRSAAAEFSDETEDALNALDGEFYLCTDNLTELLFAFVQQHPETFGTLSSD